MDWQRSTNQGWSGLSFGNVRIERRGERYRFEIEVFLGGLDSNALLVGFYADAAAGNPSVQQVMALVHGEGTGGSALSLPRHRLGGSSTIGLHPAGTRKDLTVFPSLLKAGRSSGSGNPDRRPSARSMLRLELGHGSSFIGRFVCVFQLSPTSWEADYWAPSESQRSGRSNTGVSFCSRPSPAYLRCINLQKELSG